MSSCARKFGFRRNFPPHLMKLLFFVSEEYGGKGLCRRASLTLMLTGYIRLRM